MLIEKIKNNETKRMDKMLNKKKINYVNGKYVIKMKNLVLITFLSIFLLTILLIIILSVNLVSAGIFSKSNVAYSQDPGITGSMGDVKFPLLFDRSQCAAGQDFILQISPTGCIPSVVRSDLLEEQNVPVFCPIVATQLNPLIKVDAINTVSFSGEIPKEVSGIGYYPARAAVVNPQTQLNQPVFNNVGYAVIVLKQQRNESSMPDFVSGNLTARITYDVKNAFGVGQATFYLPEMSPEQWEREYKKYVFWAGRGFLKADSITDNTATISIYSDRETYGTTKTAEKRKITTVNLDLEQRRKSQDIYMPGFDSCLGSLQLELKGLENPSTTVRLNINGDLSDFKKDEKFIDNKCYVKSIEKQGVVDRVVVKCDDDEGIGDLSLIIAPRVKLDIDGIVGDYSIGDRLYQDNEGRNVYLAYLTTDGDSMNEKNLITVFIATPDSKADKLSESELSSIAGVLSRQPSVKNIKNLPSAVWEGFKALFSLSEQFLRGVVEGKGFRDVSFNQTEDVFGKNVKLVGFADAVDADISSLTANFKEYFEKSIKDYDTVLESFSNEKYPNTGTVADKTLGEQALYNKIGLMWEANQKRTVGDLCREFEERYGSSNLPQECTEAYKLSSSESSVANVVIAGRTYSVSLERIREPSFDELGARVYVRGPGIDRSFDLRNNQIIYLNQTENEYIQLVDIEKDSARFSGSLTSVGAQASVLNFLGALSKTLKKGVPDNFGSKYTFTLQEVNLKKVAKVSVNPEINYARTNATFDFKIGIEKRGIQLSPEKTKEIIESLKKTIGQLRGINEKIGTVVKGFNAACIGVGTTLTIKNFFANLAGEGIARLKVMRTPEIGWFAKCEAAVNRGEYEKSIDKCLLENSDKIGKAVEEYKKVIEAQNEEIKRLQEGITTTSSFLGEDVVDTNKLMERYVTNEYKNELRGNVLGKFVNNKIRVGNQDVDVSNIINEMSLNTILITQARNLQLNSRLLNSADPSVREIALSQVKAELGDIWVNSRQTVERTNFERASQNDVDNPWVDVYSGVGNKEGVYRGSTAKSGNGFGITEGTPVMLIVFNNQKYTLELEEVSTDNYRIKNVYDESKRKLENNDPVYLGITRFISPIKRYDSSTYKNKYLNPEVRYYETGEYKGLPAIVPFDRNDGWYAATQSNLPIAGGIKPFGDSGRVTSFYLCNVGQNGKEEFNSGIGDDICRGFVWEASQPPDFPGLSPSEVSVKKNRAELAIRDASQKYSAGVKKVTIGTETFDVGSPYVGTPAIQCQDFMSPGDCNILFNVCDPVVCPSSRCNLGGTYNVENVVQSGVIGSLALCLPNFPEVKVPICLSGVYAGIDSYLSVLDSYQQCLQTSLNTGQTVGVCDEIHSVYMCEFFWRQGLPVVSYAVPKILGKIFSQDVRGGGEYLSVQDAWRKAGDSVDFFTDYYAKNSFAAFKARSADSLGTEICRNWVSITSPSGGKIFDALINPVSPPQFYGRFDEIPFSTVTVTPISHYKVFYHIYAGKDQPAYYQVYLRATGDSSSFYQDIPFRRVVDSGYIGAGQYASQTRDFTAPSGYKELCIVVNNQEECGFKQVTTEFGINYMTEMYVADQAARTDIVSEAECISGTPNIYSLLNPNIQAGVEEGINPAIYNRGITRVCSTDNPGKGTDSFVGTNQSRWLDVGYCGDKKMRCWLDSESVKNVIESTDIGGKVLGEVSDNYVDTLKKELGIVEDFESVVKGIEDEKDPFKKIEKINADFAKVFFNHEKGYLYLLRGNIYKELALRLIPKPSEKPTTTIDKPKLGEKSIDEIIQQTTTEKQKISVNYPVFKLEDNNFLGLFEQDLYLAYSGENWYWNTKSNDPNSKDWQLALVAPLAGAQSSPGQATGVQLIPNLNEENKKFLEKFVINGYSVGYLDGLISLIKRTEANKESAVLGIRDAKLSTNRIEFSPDRRFKFSKVTGIDRFFEFNSTSGKWTWSGGTREWFVVPQIPTKYSNVEEEVKKIISVLDGKGPYDGAAIIFGIDAQNQITETPTTPLSLRCSTTDECKIALGKEIIRISKEVQSQRTSDVNQQNAKIKQETGINNFECLVLMVANKESSIKHCTEYQKDGNALYCNGKINEVLKSGGDERSYGIMQINKAVHTSVDVADFEANVKKGANLLIDNYDTASKLYSCYKQIDGKFVQVWYSGWTRSLRSYNGWNSPPCTNARNYVEDVLSDSNKNVVKNLFPECREGFEPETKEEIEQEICSVPKQEVFSENVLRISHAGSRVLKAAEELNGKDAAGENCFVPIQSVYRNAGIDFSCVYPDEIGKEYSIGGNKITIGVDKNLKGETIFVVPSGRTNCLEKSNLNYEQKLNNIAPGDQLDIVWTPSSAHSVIFIRWIDKANKKAEIFDWLDGSKGNRKYRYAEISLAEDTHPVYVHKRPVILAA